MQKVFLSYAHSDTYRIAQEAGVPAWNTLFNLPRAFSEIFAFCFNVELWFDEQIRPFQLWLEEIENAILGSDAVVLLLSPDSAGSQYCQHECECAHKLSKKVATVLLWDCSAPRSVSHIQWLDMRRNISHMQNMLKNYVQWDSLIQNKRGKVRHDRYSEALSKNDEYFRMDFKKSVFDISTEIVGRLDPVFLLNAQPRDKWNTFFQRDMPTRDDWQKVVSGVASPSIVSRLFGKQ